MVIPKWFRRAFALATTLLVFAGCARHATSGDTSQANAVTGAWPNYNAQDYQKPGSPTLTSEQTALIQKTLALLKPCQASQLRYAFPEKRIPGTDTMILYFEPPENAHPHVLWTKNIEYYVAEGSEYVAHLRGAPPKGMGTAYEVQHTINC